MQVIYFSRILEPTLRSHYSWQASQHPGIATEEFYSMKIVQLQIKIKKLKKIAYLWSQHFTFSKLQENKSWHKNLSIGIGTLPSIFNRQCSKSFKKIKDDIWIFVGIGALQVIFNRQCSKSFKLRREKNWSKHEEHHTKWKHNSWATLYIWGNRYQLFKSEKENEKVDTRKRSDDIFWSFFTFRDILVLLIFLLKLIKYLTCWVVLWGQFFFFFFLFLN